MDCDWIFLGAAVCFFFRIILDFRYMHWNPIDENSPSMALIIAVLWLILPVALGLWVIFECREAVDMIVDTWTFLLGWFLGFSAYWAIRKAVGFKKHR